MNSKSFIQQAHLCIRLTFSLCRREADRNSDSARVFALIDNRLTRVLAERGQLIKLYFTKQPTADSNLSLHYEWRSIEIC